MATAIRLQKIRDERMDTVRAYVTKMRSDQIERARRNFELRPIHPDRVGYEIDQAADPDAVIVSENLTGSNGLFRLRN
ncbi:MAG TPA: hypothetical protein VGQ81_09675 [Acidobacteriota bacterium]|jgi:thiamine pyrophosphate-dependent acetolactate synthase large subunit-like protein|nr:hypothetical protein [Acidobacteriota bacterium]